MTDSHLLSVVIYTLRLLCLQWIPFINQKTASIILPSHWAVLFVIDWLPTSINSVTSLSERVISIIVDKQGRRLWLSSMVRLRSRPRLVERDSTWSTFELQKRAPVRSGSQIQLTRGFNAGQLVYTAPVTVEGQTMQVQVDTSTSDLVS